MTTVYLVRHVQAQGNLLRVFHGHVDGNITDLGIKQCGRLAERFAAVPLSAIMSSDLQRARKTALAIALRHQNVQVEFTERLREIYAGDWEGEPYDGVGKVEPEIFKSFIDGELDVRIGGFGETSREAGMRLKCAVDEFIKRHENETLAVVSHGCALRAMIELYFDGMLTWGTNATVSNLVFHKDGKIDVGYLWDDSHLEGVRGDKELD